MGTTSRWTFVVGVMCLAVVIALSPGCKSKTGVEIDPLAGVETARTAGPADSGLDTGKLSDIDVEKLFFSRITGMTIYFDYDSSALRPDALATLSKLADEVKATPGVTVQVEGHCDERGTQEYNIALGSRRALAARAHLIKLGVPADRLLPISYGEEVPAVDGHDEAAWAKNRRAEFGQSK